MNLEKFKNKEIYRKVDRVVDEEEQLKYYFKKIGIYVSVDIFSNRYKYDSDICIH